MPINLKDLSIHLRSLEQKATPGPWFSQIEAKFIGYRSLVKDSNRSIIVSTDVYIQPNILCDNSTLISETRNNLVTLLDALEKAQKDANAANEYVFKLLETSVELHRENESLRTHAQHEQELNHEAQKENALLSESFAECNIYAVDLEKQLSEAKDTIIQMSGAIDTALNTVDVPGAREHVGIGLENAAFKAHMFLDKCKE